MYARERRKRGIIRDYSIGWTVGFIFFMTIQGIATQNFEKAGVSIWKGWAFVLLIGPILGALSGYIQHIWEERYYKRMPLPRLLGVKVLFSMGFLLFLVLFIFAIDIYIVGYRQLSFHEFVRQPESVSFYAFVFVMDISLTLVRQINILLGPGNLRRFIRGDFYSPAEEERAFMFLDLKSSTATAERLGHLKYSMLIQDCFDDLAVVNEYYAEIYQYVGDEAVLTWPMKIALKNGNCVRAYFAFKDQLDARRGYYEEKYGFLPFFKAGLNAGKVIVAEVGKYKREIAYHGDTLNTAARIQEKCNDFGQDMLLSERLVSMLPPQSDLNFQELGNIRLKGKQQDVTIHTVNRIPPVRPSLSSTKREKKV